MRSRIRPQGFPVAVAATPAFNLQRGTPGEERLSVYAVGYLVRFREALTEVYEAIHHVLGEHAFAELARDYAQRYPSHDYNLSLIGRHLPEFLVSCPLTSQLPFLPDLARLEWLVCQAFHAFDQPSLDPLRFAARPLETWEQTRLIFQPSVGLMASAWPILDIWQARTQPRDAVDVDLVNRPQHVLVFRHELQVRCESIEAHQSQLLSGLLGGRTLGAMCDELADDVGDAPLPLAEWFSHWVGYGLLARVE